MDKSGGDKNSGARLVSMIRPGLKVQSNGSQERAALTRNWWYNVGSCWSLQVQQLIGMYVTDTLRLIVSITGDRALDGKGEKGQKSADLVRSIHRHQHAIPYRGRTCRHGKVRFLDILLRPACGGGG